MSRVQAAAGTGGPSLSGAAVPAELLLACPACASELVSADDDYYCPVCGRRFPVLFGIPDLRLSGDRYLSLEAEREKAGRLAAIAEAGASFAELVDHYYVMTGDVPPALAPRFKSYIASGEARAQAALGACSPKLYRYTLLDIGCGSGGLLVAAARRCALVVGLDLALRWLVIARRRLEEAGVQAFLVCADMASAPLRRMPFDRVVAMDVLEHVADLEVAFAGLATMTAPGGRLCLSASNARFPGPHPSVGLWAAGWWPPALRRAVLERRHGVDTLRAVQLMTPRTIRLIARRHGFTPISLAPRSVVAETAGRRGMEAALLELYRQLLRVRALRSLLAHAGPAFEMTLQKSA